MFIQKESDNRTDPEMMDVDYEEDEEEYAQMVGQPKYLAGRRWTEFVVVNRLTWPRRMIKGDGRHVNSDSAYHTG